MKRENNNRLTKFIGIIMCICAFCLCVLGNITTSYARNSIDTSKKGMLKLTYAYTDANNTEYLQGVTMHAYKIADVDATGTYTLLSGYSEIFSQNNIDINSISTSEEWDMMIPGTLAYIYGNMGDVISYTATSTADGIAKITDMDLGVYLIVTDSLKTDDSIYTFSSFFAAIPQIDSETDTYIYSDDDGAYTGYLLVGSPKCHKDAINEDTTYDIYKYWSDDGDDRPSSIDVSIYLDGSLYTKVTLSSSNNWHYSWTYEKGHSFAIVEDVPSGYYVTYSVSGTTYTMTNTKPDTPDTPGTPDTPDTPTTNNPTSEVLGAVRSVITGDDTPSVLGKKRLPQTGQLWWPVFAFAILGIAFIYIGLKNEKKQKDNI